jgi:hypothetical protein
MNEAVKKLIAEFDGTVLLGGTLVMFSAPQFVKLFMKVYEVGMEKGREENAS